MPIVVRRVGLCAWRCGAALARRVQQKTVDNTICVQLDVQLSAQGV